MNARKEGPDMDNEVKEVKMNINLEALSEDRKGHFANFFTASNSERVMILDCFLIDLVGNTDEGQARNGILTSRILMDATAAIQLRDMLSSHIERNGWTSDDA